MRVKITRLRKGVFIPRAKAVLALVAAVTQDVADIMVDDIVENDIPRTLRLRSKFTQDDWDAFTNHFESYQLPGGALSAPSDYSGEPDDLDKSKLKLFKVMVDYDQFYTVLVLAKDEHIAIACAREELAARGSDLNYEVNKNSVSCEARELTDFKNGSVLSVVADISVVPNF